MTVARKRGSTQTLLQRILRVFHFPVTWQSYIIYAKNHNDWPGDGHQKFNSTKKMGENPQVVSSTPQKISIQPFPTPPTLHVDPSSPSILDLGCSKSGALQRWHLRVWRFTLPLRCRTKKTAVVKGLALFLKQSTGLIEKKKKKQFSQAMYCSKSEKQYGSREIFLKNAGRASAGKTCAWSCGEWLSKSENGELMWRLPLSESWFSWLMDFNHPQLHSSVPANYQLLSRFAASKNLHLPELRSFGRIPRSPFLKKKNTVKAPFTVRLSEVFLKSFAQISQLFYGTQDPTSYHQLTIILPCSNFFVSNVSLDPWVWSPKFTHEKWSQLFNLSHTLYVHHEYTYQYN